MELSLVKSDFKRRRAVYNGNCEIGLESEIVLPDAFTDIERILKCTLSPRVQSKRLDSGRLSINGSAFLHILYLDGQNCVKSFDTQVPFSKNIDVNAEGENPIICVKLSTQYLNCRVLSERRFDMRATVCMSINIKACDTVSILTDIQNESVELKKQKIEATVPVFSACENFTVMEEYELSAPISAVVKMNADARVLEHKTVSGRILIRGEVEIDLAYLCEGSDMLQNAHYVLPLSHILSCPEAEENDDVIISLEICKLSCEPIGRSGDREISVEVLLEACAEVNRREEIDAVVDAYCIGRESAVSKNQTELAYFERYAEKNHKALVKTQAEDIAEIIDTFAEVKNVEFNLNGEGELMAKCDIDATLIYKNSEGEALVSNASAPLEISVAADREFMGANCSGEVKVISADRGQSKNEVGVSLLLSGRVLKNANIVSVCSMQVSEQMQRNDDPKTALTIYFAEKGEDAFDIAKRYNTSARAVMEENHLDESLINENKRILIPMVR